MSDKLAPLIPLSVEGAHKTADLRFSLDKLNNCSSDNMMISVDDIRRNESSRVIDVRSSSKR